MGTRPRSHAEIYLHVVWATRYRHPLLGPGLIERVHDSIRRCCVELGCDPLAVGGVEDHVHLLVRIPSTLSAAALAHKVKGASSYRTNLAHGPQATLRWQDGYGVLSVSPRGIPAVSSYVLDQPRHHASGTTQAALERVDDSAP